MRKRSLAHAALAMLTTLSCLVAQAGPIITEDPDRTGMTHFLPTSPAWPFGTMAILPDVIVTLADADGQPLVELTDPSWWNPVQTDPTDPDLHRHVFTTSTHRIDVSFMGAPVFGFAFNVGANVPAWANIVATFSNGTTLETMPWFPVGQGDPASTPSWGVFGDQSTCTSITGISVDPHITWGIGNMAIQTGSCGTTSVPEPDVSALIGIGCLAMFALRRRVRARGSRA